MAHKTKKITQAPKAPKAPKAAKPKKAKASLRKDGKPDLRKLPATKRPKPTTGQSRKAFDLPADGLSKNETKVVQTLKAAGGTKSRKPFVPVAAISKATRLTGLQVRNSIRRLVPGGWAVQGEGRGMYRLAPKAARKTLSA